MKKSQIFLFGLLSCISTSIFYGQYLINDPIEVSRGSNGQSSFITNNHNPFIWSTQNAALPYPFGDVDLGHLVIQSRTSSPRDILFITGNGDDIRMSIKGDGNVGIGTANPGAKLYVNGQNAMFFSNTGANRLKVGRNSSENISIYVEDRNAYVDLEQDADENDPHVMYFRNLAGGTSPDNDIRFQTSSTDRLTIKTDGNVGIGTNSPASKLDVNGAVRAQDVITVQTGGAYKVALNGQSDGYIAGRDNSFSQKFLIRSNGNSWFNGGNVGVGTTTPDEMLTVKGRIHAEEVRVDLSVPGPDYVFEEGYDLKSLEEVQRHIQEKGHLPNIPSAREMEENGVELGIMNMKLLEKIEELTLYQIQLLETLKTANKEINDLEKRVRHLEGK